MNKDGETLHYRSRFEVTTAARDESALPSTLEAIWRWVRQKEDRRGDESLRDALAAKGAEDDFIQGRCNLPQGSSAGSRLRTASFNDQGKQALWAMDYDEPEGSFRFRRWHTRIGLSQQEGGPCLVNINVGYYLLPEFLGSAKYEPGASVPRVVGDILGAEGLHASVGNTPLLVRERRLSAEDFDAEFANRLVDPERELPLVLMATGWDGSTPVRDATWLAGRVLGLANVYVVDWADEPLRNKVRELFKWDTPAYGYRCGINMLRIYRPGLDLADPQGQGAHRFFTKVNIDRLCGVDDKHHNYDALASIVNRGLSRSVGRSKRDVIDIEDVDRAKSRAQTKQLRMQAVELKERAAAREAKRKADAERKTVSLESALAEAEKDRDEWQELAESLQEDNDKLEMHINAVETQYLDCERSLAQARYQVDAANDRAAEAEGRAVGLQQAQQAIYSLEKMPSSLAEVLDFAERLWSDRIVVLDQARRSAEEFTSGDLDEEWQIIKSVPTVLYDICLGDDGTERSSIENDYREKTGFELTMRETTLTKANKAFMRERARTYRGEEIDITPHIKGKRCTKAGSAFRLHFYVDRSRSVIVIGHCGDHMTTAGTQYQH